MLWSELFHNAQSIPALSFLAGENFCRKSEQLDLIRASLNRLACEINGFACKIIMADNKVSTLSVGDGAHFVKAA